MTEQSYKDFNFDNGDNSNHSSNLDEIMAKFDEINLNEDFTRSEVNKEAKEKIKNEFIDLKNKASIQDLSNRIQTFESVNNNLRFISLLLHIVAYEEYEIESIIRAEIIQSMIEIDNTKYIKLSLFLQILSNCLVIVNTKQIDISKEYCRRLETDVVNMLKICHYLIVDDEIISGDSEIIASIQGFISLCLSNRILAEKEIFSISEDLTLKLISNPSKCLENCSFALVSVLHQVTDSEQHKLYVDYLSQMQLQLQTIKEDKSNQEFLKLKKTISSKMSSAISIFLIAHDESKSAPGLEIILDLILVNCKEASRYVIAFALCQRIEILYPNDLECKYNDKVKQCLDEYISNFKKIYNKEANTRDIIKLSLSVILLKPIEFLLQIYTKNCYDECKNDCSKIYKRTELLDILSIVSNFLVQLSKYNKSTLTENSGKKIIPIPLAIIDNLLNILDLCIYGTKHKIRFDLYLRLLVIAKFNFEMDAKFGPHCFRLMSYFSRVDVNVENEQEKKMKEKTLLNSIKDLLTQIVNAKDLISYYTMLEYYKALKIKIVDPTNSYKTDDLYSDQNIDSMLTNGCIEKPELDINKYHSNMIMTAYNAIVKQDLANNCKIDTSKFIPKHYSKLNQTYNLNSILEKCFDMYKSCTVNMTDKQIIKIKESCMYLMYEYTLAQSSEFDQKKLMMIVSNHIETEITNV